MFKVICTNRINIQNVSSPLSEAENKFLKTIKMENTLRNPEYDEAEKRGRWLGKIPLTIPLVQIEKEGISLPRGYASRLLGWAKRYQVEVKFIDNRRELPITLFKSNIQLRDYQKPAVDAMSKSTQGVLVAPAGSGKTSMGMELISRIGQPTLWLTHTHDLARQAMDRAEEYLGIPWAEIGLIGGGQIRINSRLTVALVQSLSKTPWEEMQRLLARFGLLITDECQHVPAITFSHIIDASTARYRFGLTATPDRADDLGVMIERYIGPILYEVPRSAVIDTRNIITPMLRTIKTDTISETFQKHEVRMKEYEQKCGEARLYNTKMPRKPRMNYGLILDDILSDKERNRLIIQTLVQEAPGHYSLVLSERIDHINLLADMLAKADPGIKTAAVHGKTKDRDEIIEAVRAGNISVLFAVDLAKEGLDIPRLDRLFLVAGGNSESETEQKVGRIQRIFPGKRDAAIFDFIDEAIAPVAAQWWSRLKVYRRLGMVGSNRVAI